jgi:hypothetical protein
MAENNAIGLASRPCGGESQTKHQREWRAILVTLAFNEIVSKKQMDSILVQLERSVDSAVAEDVYREAMFKYLALKESGKLSEYEHESTSSRFSDRAGRFLMLAGLSGIAGTTVGYGFSYFDHDAFRQLLGLSGGSLTIGLTIYILGRP